MVSGKRPGKDDAEPDASQDVNDISKFLMLPEILQDAFEKLIQDDHLPPFHCASAKARDASVLHDAAEYGVMERESISMKLQVSDTDWAALLAVVIGAVNWGLFGIVHFDLVQVVFGTSPVLANIVYAVIGISGAYWCYKLIFLKR